MMLPSRLGCPLSLKTPNMGNPGFIGLGSMGSAYLWMAAESDAHPLDPELSVTLAILFAMAAIMITVPLIAWSKSRSDGQSSSD